MYQGLKKINLIKINRQNLKAEKQNPKSRYKKEKINSCQLISCNKTNLQQK